MRRDDEAFKNEVLRRYGVQKQNRRNVRLYAASTGILLILAAFIAVPVATGRSLPDVVASWLAPVEQQNQFAEYLDQPITQLRVVNWSSNAFRDCTETETEEVKELLLKLSLTELLSAPENADDTYHFVIMMETRQANIHALSGGYLCVIYSGPGMDPNTPMWYQIPQNEYTALTKRADKILDTSTPVTTPDRNDPEPTPTPSNVTTLTDFLASSAIDEMRLGGYYQNSEYVSFIGSSNETDTVMGLLRELDLSTPDPWSMNWYPETSIQLILEPYTMTIGADPHTGWLQATLSDTDTNRISETYYKATPAKVKALVICVEELLYGESSLNKPPTIDPDQVLDGYLNGTISSMNLSSFSVQSHTHSCSAEEIERILSELKKLTKSKSEPMEYYPSGAVVHIVAEDIRIMLTFDPSGYMEMRCFSSDLTQTTLVQGYKIPKDQVTTLTAAVQEIMYGK